MNSALAVVIGLVLAIVLIVRKVSPFYSLMLAGVKDITPAILRILAAGVLSGALIKTGATASSNAGATMLDHLPHGSFFHATGGSVNMSIKERMKLIPYESLVGLVLTLTSLGCYLILG